MLKGKRLSLKDNTALTFLACLGFSLLALVLFSVVFAIIANLSNDPTSMLGLFSLGALILGGAVGGFFSARMKKEGTLLFSLLVALAIVMLMLIICVVICGKISGSAFMNYGCYIGISALTSLLGSRERKHKHRRR